MNEPNESVSWPETHGQKPVTCRFALWSFLLGLASTVGLIDLQLLWHYRALGWLVLAGPVAVVLGLIGACRIKRTKRRFKGFGFAAGGVIIGAVVSVVIGLGCLRAFRLSQTLFCGSNVDSVRKHLLIYANDFGAYPAADKWCDSLIEHTQAGENNFVCPSADNGKCHYALNPKAEPNGPGDVVLLFETEGGWNQYGGPEILSARHKAKDTRGCNVLFADGHIEFVRSGDIEGLKWEMWDPRLPKDDAELEYWLENMILYHCFSNDEISAVMGLRETQIITGISRFGIRHSNRPNRTGDAPILVLPYPGGRHPRIGFLDGAIDPQRETKFSVFTPWDANSYVVVDVPEAIWSNLGLTYLAHTHIDTIWTAQGIELEKLEWNRRPDGGLDIERTLPNGIAFGVKVEPTQEAVLMEMWLRNGTDKKLTGLRIQNCVMTKMARGFEQQTNENKVITNPYVACKSSDGKRWMITAWEGCHNPWANDKCPCFHSDPKFPDLEPGQKETLKGWLSFYEGEDIEAEFKRIEATGWRE